MRTLKPRRTLAAAAAALVGVSALVASGSAASADVTAQDTCDRGEVCVYMGGELVASGEGNLSGSYGPWDEPGKIVNNGWAQPGLDHIRYERSTGGTVCLHYPEDSGGSNTGHFDPGVVVSNIRWGGDC